MAGSKAEMPELIEQSRQLLERMSSLQTHYNSPKPEEASFSPAPKKERLLKLSLTHYKQQGCSDEEMHRHISQDHAVKASKVLTKHGVEMYGFFFTTSPARDLLAAACAALQNEWKIEQHDLIVEFYFRDMSDLVKVATDPELLAIQEEVPYITKEGLVASLGWVEHFIMYRLSEGFL